jgi:hypothetical protein
MCEECRNLLEAGHGPTYTSLFEQLQEMDKDVPEGDDNPQQTKLWKSVSKAVMRSMESFNQPGRMEDFTRAFKKHPGLWQCVVEDHYLRECFDRIPAMVKRAGRLIPLTMGRIPSHKVQHFLNEATRCFIYGFFQASAALSRAALESGLSEHLIDRLSYVPDMNLSVKIEKAAQFKLISAKSAFLANAVRVAANQVLHNKPASEGQALRSLTDARAVLAELYKT